MGPPAVNVFALLARVCYILLCLNGLWSSCSFHTTSIIVIILTRPGSEKTVVVITVYAPSLVLHKLYNRTRCSDNIILQTPSYRQRTGYNAERHRRGWRQPTANRIVLSISHEDISLTLYTYLLLYIYIWTLYFIIRIIYRYVQEGLNVYTGRE